MDDSEKTPPRGIKKLTPRRYPLPRPPDGDDKRFTFGLGHDVAAVLARHGYPAIDGGPDHVALQQALFGFIYASEETPAIAGAQLAPLGMLPGLAQRSPLAVDEYGAPFELHPTVIGWRVERLDPARHGRKEQVINGIGGPLKISLDWTAEQLRGVLAICEGLKDDQRGYYALVPVDDSGAAVGDKRGYVLIADEGATS